MNKEKLERIFRETGAKPVGRYQAGNYNVFIGDGFSMIPHRPYTKFGIDPMDFPNGMYVTWWWIGKDEKLDIGQPMFFDAFHDMGYSQNEKQRARVNTALKEARDFLRRRKNNAAH